MLGSFELQGIETIDSLERRALVEHRVPGLAGSYFQDLGAAPNTIVISGTRAGDDARDDFLNGIRDLFNKGEETTFAADINTATDITNVVIEDLDVAEVAGVADTFRYRVTLRKYVKPPEPPATGLPGLDSDLLDDAGKLMDAIDTLDALGSVPDFGDPTPPLKGALGDVDKATAAVEPAVTDLQTGLGEDPAGPAGSLPSKDDLSGSLQGLSGDASSGTGVAGALDAVQQADVGGKTTDLVSKLDGSLASKLPAEGAAPGADAVGHLNDAVATVPKDPATLTGPVSQPLDQIKKLVSPDVTSGILGGLNGLQGAQSSVPSDPTSLLSGGIDQIQKVAQGLETGNLGALRGWTDALSGLNGEIEALLKEGAGTVEVRLIGFLADRATSLRNEILPGGAGPGARVATAVDTAVAAHLAPLQTAANDLSAALGRAVTELQAGQFSSTTDVAAAEDALGRVVTEAGGLATALKGALDDAAATSSGLADALKHLYDDFHGIDVVDLARPRELFDHAFGELQSAIAEVDLGAAHKQVADLLDELGKGVDALDLDKLTQGLDEAEQAIRSALDTLGGAVLEVVALVRAALARVKEAVDSVASALGSVGEDGKFHFTVETEIESLLNEVTGVIRDTIEPAIAEFKGVVEQAIGKVTEILGEVQGEVDSVKAQLTSAIQGATDQLRQADLGGKMDQITQTLKDALDQLGPIDFDVVVDPVVGEIGEMRDKLKSIDPSKMNDILRAALSVAVGVLTAIDFPHDITQALMGEIDKLLKVPKDALDELQGRVDAMLAKFADLEPTAIVEPLSGLFAPLEHALDGMDVEALAAPIEEWHRNAKAELEKVMPAALLKPLVDAYDEMSRSLAAISSATLVESLNSTIAQIKGDLQRLEPAALVGQLTSAFDDAKRVLESLAPEKLLEPLVAAFDRVTAAIDALSPEPMLAPLTTLSANLKAPLESLTDDDARRAAEAFAPLVGLPDGFDPQRSFAAASSKLTDAETRLAALNLATLLADARTQQAAAAAALGGAGDAGAALLPRVQALDPLQNAQLNQALADLQELRGRLRSGFASADPPADLVSAYGEIRSDVEGLVPEWVKTPTADAIRQALSFADPGAIADAVRELHTQIHDQWTALDPRSLAQQLQATYDRVVQSVSALDPAAIAGRIQGLVQELGPRLDALSLDSVGHDVEDLEADVRSVIEGLDPRPVIERLNGVATEAENAIDQLDPAPLLEELRQPLDAAKGILREFDPKALAEALEPAYAAIQEILKKVDLRELLKPLVDRMQELRDALEQALTRTEHAFDEMIAAIPR